MTTRFNFRAFVFVDGYDSDGNDKEYKFYIYNVVPYGGTSIGFSYDDLCAALDNTNYTDKEKELIISALDDSEYSQEWYNYDGFVEQFVGRTDKHNKPIYEGDTVRCFAEWLPGGQVVAQIVWVPMIAGFCIHTLDKTSIPSWNNKSLLGMSFEIIGDIHTTEAK